METIADFFVNNQTKRFQDNLLKHLNEKNEIEKQINNTRQRYKNHVAESLCKFLLNKIDSKYSNLKRYLGSRMEYWIYNQLELDLNVVQISQKEVMQTIFVDENEEESIKNMDDFVAVLNSAWNGFVVLKTVDVFNFSWKFVV
jgi:uncharacterized protein (DUF3084 family)